MTNKELLYVEDAISHENTIISFLSYGLNVLESNVLCEFFEREIVHHNEIRNDLLGLLKGEGKDDR